MGEEIYYVLTSLGKHPKEGYYIITTKNLSWKIRKSKNIFFSGLENPQLTKRLADQTTKLLEEIGYDAICGKGDEIIIGKISLGELKITEKFKTPLYPRDFRNDTKFKERKTLKEIIETINGN